MNLAKLRPLSLGELLDRVFSSYRQHFWVFVGIMVPPQVILVAGSLVQQGLMSPIMRPGRTSSPADLIADVIGGNLLTLSLYLIVNSVALGATTLAVSEFYLGRSITIRQSYERLRGRTGKLIATILLQAAGTGGLVAVPIMALALIVALLPRTGGGTLTVLLVGVVFGLLIIGLAVIALILTLRLAVSVPAVVLEKAGALDALKRSFRLTRDYAGRIFLIILLMGFIDVVALTVFQIPFMIATFFLAFRGGSMPLWLSTPMAISAGIGQALSGPLLLIAMALAYYDMRIRKEGLDLQLMIASLGAPGPQPGVLHSSAEGG